MKDRSFFSSFKTKTVASLKENPDLARSMLELHDFQQKETNIHIKNHLSGLNLLGACIDWLSARKASSAELAISTLCQDQYTRFSFLFQSFPC